MCWSSRSRAASRSTSRPRCTPSCRRPCRCCRCAPTSATPRRRSRCRPDARLRVTCGEVAFDVYAAEPAAAVPRPRFGADLRDGGRYTLGVALTFLALLLIVRAIPEDPQSLSGDNLGRLRWLSPTVTIPLDINSPEIDSKIANKVPGGGGSAAAKGPQGQAGDKTREASAARRAVAGQRGAQGRAGGGGRRPEEHAAQRARRADARFGGRGVRAPRGAGPRRADDHRPARRDDDRERLRRRRPARDRHRRGRRRHRRAHARSRRLRHARQVRRRRRSGTRPGYAATATASGRSARATR